ncbi:MAG TPA: ComEC/Rec2 family competence protein [Jiangellales bacterium]|nr:ComEC/Rec2 family competence protein [Jiangellales bacterium]
MRQRLGPDADGAVGSAEPADLRLVPTAVAAWAGVLTGLHAPMNLQAGVAVGAAVLALVSMALVRSRPGRLAIGMALAAALAGLAGGATRAAAVHDGPVARLAAVDAQVSVAAVVTSDPALRDGEGFVSGEPYVVAQLRVERIAGRGVTAWVRTPVVLVASDPAWVSLLPGTPVSLSGRLAAAEGGPVAGFLRTAEAPRPTGPPGLTSRLTEPFRGGLRTAVDGLPAAAQGIVPGMAVGDESKLPQQIRRDMQETGLTHLTAVSGVHVTVVLIAVLGLARWVGVRGYGLPVIAIVAIVAFALLVRPEPSVVRATTMGLIGVVGLTAAGRRRALPALAAAVLVLLLLDPWLAVSVGFALSVLSTVGILLFSPVWRDAVSWVPRPVAAAIAVPMAAQVASIPVLVAFVNETSLAALPANVLVAPAVAPTTLLGVLAAAVSPVLPSVAAAAAWLAGWPAQWVAVVAARGARLPGAVVYWPDGAAGVLAATVLVVLLVAVLPRLLRRRLLSVAAAVAALALLVGAPNPGWPPRGWLLVACPVGQGDAFAIRSGPASAVVVDAGPDPDLADRCLDELGVTRVHLLVLTHFHADHVAGLPGVLQGRRVDEVMVSPLAEPAELASVVAERLAAANIPTRIAAVGEHRLLGQVELQVIWPARIIGAGEPAANDASVVFHAVVHGIDVLMTGDVEPPAQAAIERADPHLRADVLKVPHHGSRFQELDWLARIGAEVALIGVGEGNRHGHPAADTVRALEAAGAAVWRTDQHGAIAVVRMPDGRLGVTAQGPGIFGQ